jgi:hypothetical protein
MGSAQSTSCATLSPSCAERSGKNQVDPKLTALSNETVTVLDIGHYRVRSKNGEGIILHDFVGLRVSFGDGIICKIRAEKSQEGISVELEVKRWDTDDVQMKHRAEELEDCGDIRMEDLLAILKEPSPKYSLTSDNCWKYADATFKQVIRKFLETPSLTPDRRSYLASFLNNPPPVMPVYVIISLCFDVPHLIIGPIILLILICSTYPTLALFELLPISIFVVLSVFIHLYKVVTFVKGATWLGKSIKKWRSLFSRRRLKQAQGLPSM